MLMGGKEKQRITTVTSKGGRALSRVRRRNAWVDEGR